MYSSCSLVCFAGNNAACGRQAQQRQLWRAGRPQPAGRRHQGARRIQPAGNPALRGAQPLQDHTGSNSHRLRGLSMFTCTMFYANHLRPLVFSSSATRGLSLDILNFIRGHRTNLLWMHIGPGAGGAEGADRAAGPRDQGHHEGQPVPHQPQRCGEGPAPTPNMLPCRASWAVCVKAAWAEGFEITAVSKCP